MTPERTEIERIEKEFGWVIEIEERIPLWKTASIMARDYARIRKYLEGKQGIKTGIPYARYLDVDWEAEMTKEGTGKFLRLLTGKRHVQVGIPIGIHLESSGLMNTRKIGRRLYIRTMHHGPYHTVGQTYKNIYAWAKKQGETPGNQSIECYLNDPQETEKSRLETMVLIPVSGIITS
ncbi:MAG: GyrI-like domain-containing protein [Candidatus Electrothrix sp. YB6]